MCAFTSAPVSRNTSEKRHLSVKFFYDPVPTLPGFNVTDTVLIEVLIMSGTSSGEISSLLL
jgi:hypothetical protein